MPSPVAGPSTAFAFSAFALGLAGVLPPSAFWPCLLGGTPPVAPIISVGAPILALSTVLSLIITTIAGLMSAVVIFVITTIAGLMLPLLTTVALLVSRAPWLQRERSLSLRRPSRESLLCPRRGVIGLLLRLRSLNGLCSMAGIGIGMGMPAPMLPKHPIGVGIAPIGVGIAPIGVGIAVGNINSIPIPGAIIGASSLALPLPERFLNIAPGTYGDQGNMMVKNTSETCFENFAHSRKLA